MMAEDTSNPLPADLPPKGNLRCLWQAMVLPAIYQSTGAESKANRSFYNYLRPLFRRLMPDAHFMNYGLWRDDAEDGKNPAQRLFAFLLSHADIQPDHRLLHVGSGLGGPDRELLSTQTFGSLTSLDHNMKHVAIAERYLADHGLYPQDDVRLVCGDAMALSKSGIQPASLDRVLACECVDEFPSRSGFYQEAYRVLRPGGKLVSVDVFLIDPPTDEAMKKRIRKEASAWSSSPFYSQSDLERDLKAAGFDQVAFHSFAKWVWKPFLSYAVEGDRSINEAKALGYPPMARRMIRDYMRSLEGVAHHYDYAVVVANKTGA